MSKYNVSPGGVQKTLKATATQAGKFEDLLQPLGGHVKSGASACGNSGAVVGALQGLFSHEQTELKNMSTQISACVSGAAAATEAYIHGDYQMMLTYQKNAKNAKITKMPKKYK